MKIRENSYSKGTENKNRLSAVEVGNLEKSSTKNETSNPKDVISVQNGSSMINSEGISDSISDSQGNIKGPWRITFDTNPDDCNLSCVMCEEFSEYSDLKQLRMLEGGPKRRRMDVALIENVLKDAADYNSVNEIIPSTMGEPLLFREFERILDLCREYDVRLNLTTNGTFPKKGVEKWAKLIVPVGSDVKISWNGVTKEVAEKVMKKVKFPESVSNLKRFIAIRDEIFQSGGNYCSVTLQYTFMEMNSYELPELVKFAANLGVDRIKGHHLWAHFKEIKEQSMRRNSQSIKRWNQIVERIYSYAERYRRPNGQKIKLDNIFPLDTNSSSKELIADGVCPFLKKEAWVAWDGRFNPCCAPDASRKKLGFFGNLKETSFREIWEGKPYRNLTKNYLDYDLCKNCNMRRLEEET